AARARVGNLPLAVRAAAGGAPKLSPGRRAQRSDRDRVGAGRRSGRGRDASARLQRGARLRPARHACAQGASGGGPSPAAVSHDPGADRRGAWPPRGRWGRAPAPFDVNWRMGYVGTVSFVDAHGESLRTVRYAAAACDDPRELVVKMTADVRSALKRQPDLKVGIVQDGAHEMWNRTREGLQTLRGEGLLASWEEGIDRYHLLERIADAMTI